MAGVGAVFGILTLSDASKLKGQGGLCPGGVCTRQGDAAASSATTKLWVATIALPIGVAAAGAGLVLVLTSRGAAKSDAAAASLSFGASPSGGHCTLSGTF